MPFYAKKLKVKVITVQIHNTQARIDSQAIAKLGGNIAARTDV